MRIVYLIPLLFLFTCCKKEKLNSYVVSQGSGVYDIDSNFYKTVKIGETEWMAENLRVSSLNNGQKITEAIKITDLKENQDIPMFTYYNFDSTFNTIYGKLYNQKIVYSGVCPTRWHVPKEDEWLALIEGFGGEKYAGRALKEVGLIHWNSPNEKVTNETMLSFKGGGFFNFDGEFEGLKTNTAWWAEKTKYTIEFSPWAFKLENNSDRLQGFYQSWSSALYIRCKKD